MLKIGLEVADACARGLPVVAVESVIISPAGKYPDNLTLFEEVSQTIRSQGAIPALVAVIDGQIVIGPDAAQLEKIGRAKSVSKAGKRELAMALVKGNCALTTVSATIFCARLAGIHVAMTGAIGGIHRGYEETLDASSDLEEIAANPVAIVCTGAKIILDLPRTLEFLETKSVPVIGYRTGNFPAYFGSTQLSIDRLDEPEQVAALLDVHWQLGSETGVVVAIAPPSEMAAELLEELVEKSLNAAKQAGIAGKALTPFLLAQLDQMTSGQADKIRHTAILAVAKAAGQIAAAFARRRLDARAS